MLLFQNDLMFFFIAVDCGTPAPVPNAWSSPIRQTTYGAEIQYRCKTGFVSEGGNGTMICSERGQWEGAHFNCSGNKRHAKHDQVLPGILY